MHLELEFKYKADHITWNQFKSFIKSQPAYYWHRTVSGFDYYYCNQDDPDFFIRFRNDRRYPELTVKKKHTDNNNFIRTEPDLPLDPDRLTKGVVKSFVELNNCTENFRIFKNAIVADIGDYTYSYYIVYDDNIKELGRFIEIELDKYAVEDLVGKGINPLEELTERARELEALGLTLKHRLKRSLFEMYRK